MTDWRADLAASAGVETVAEVGGGAFAQVYRARQAGQTYALKISRARDQNEIAAAFRREAACLSRLVHPALARAYHVGAVQGRPYLLMTWVPGVQLDRLAAGRVLSEAELVVLARDCAGALGVAHRAGVVHRDVKPPNILVGADGHATIIDFGMAGRFGTAAPPDQGVVGTLAYAAPEQTGMLHRPVDGRADLYALGVVLYEAATGVPAFTAPDAGRLARMHLLTPAPDPGERRPGLSPGFRRIVRRLMEKDPDSRYQTAESLVADLDRLSGDRHSPVIGAPDRRPPVPGRLFGRSAERERLRECWGQAEKGRGGIVIVSGPGGIGKSHLVRDLLAEIGASGAAIMESACQVDVDRPLEVLHEAVEHGLHRRRPEAPDGDDVVDRLLSLIRWSGPTALHLDNAQWIDDTGCAALRRLAEEAGTRPLLILLSVADDHDDDSLERLRRNLRGALHDVLRLGPLDVAALEASTAATLGDLPASPEAMRQLSIAAGGNPGVLHEYAAALLDAGALVPHRGRWALDAGALEHVEIPARLAEAVRNRFLRLGPASRDVLTAAAVLGHAFDVSTLLAMVGDDPAGVVPAALSQAQAHRLIEVAPHGGYRFGHENIRQVALAGTPEQAVRDLHVRAADALAAGVDLEAAYAAAAAHLRTRTGPICALLAALPATPQVIYAIARHHRDAGPDRRPGLALVALRAAGALALADHAATVAAGYLDQALSVSAQQRRPADTGLLELRAIAALRTGRLSLARDLFEAALTAETEPAHRILLQLSLSQAAFGAMDYSTARRTAELAAKTLPQAGVGVAGVRALMRLNLLGATLMLDRPADARHPLRTAGLLWSRLPERREDGALMLAAGALVEALAGRRDAAYRKVAASRRLADGVSSEPMHAYVSNRDALARAALGDDPDLEHLTQSLTRHGERLHIGDYLMTASVLLSGHGLRGNTRQQLTWHDNARLRLSAGTAPNPSHPFFHLFAATRAIRGEHAAAAMAVTNLADAAQTVPAGTLPHLQLLTALLHAYVELGETGPPFDHAADQLEQHFTDPDIAVALCAPAWVWCSWGRIAQSVAASNHPAAVARAARAVDIVADTAHSRIVRAHHDLLRAALCHVHGDHRAAAAFASSVPVNVEQLSSPLIEFEAARARARDGRTRGDDHAASRWARHADQVAQDHGWPARRRSIMVEFTAHAPGSLETGSRTRGTETLRSRRLDALQQVSRAGATVLEPRELARVVLDETLRILPGERAVLFLADQHDDLQVFLGRTQDGRDVTAVAEHSATVVRQVYATGEPLVITGTAEGAAIGSRSAVHHDLRSIVAAPLAFAGRRLGVVYLDSRVAKGIFTGDDIAILVAITQHVAVSLETAKAAATAAEARAAQQQRKLVELLRSTVAALASVLDPADVIRSTMTMVADVLPGDALYLLHPAVDGWQVAEVSGERPEYQPGQTWHRLPASPPWASKDQPLRRDGTVPGLPPDWIAIPLDVPDDRPGTTVLITAAGPDRFDDGHLTVASMLFEQCTLAYRKASLLRELTRLANVDTLTGLSTRRHFFERANAALAAGAAMSTVMIDVDHFKRINDTYGHGVGDEVLSAVGQRLRAGVPDGCILGRYGGEEFAAIQPGDPFEAAAVAERLRLAMSGHPIETSAGPVPVTVSIGVAHHTGAEDLDELMSRADAALYQAKMGGRNRVVGG